LVQTLQKGLIPNKFCNLIILIKAQLFKLRFYFQASDFRGKMHFPIKYTYVPLFSDLRYVRVFQYYLDYFKVKFNFTL